MSSLYVLFFTGLALCAFAGNSLLCRIALTQTAIDPISFAVVRLFSGAVMLAIILYLRNGKLDRAGNWFSALALFAYAVGFSIAYVHLSAATGALLLFGAVQMTMISYGLWRGETLRGLQILGLAIALVGLISLLLPGLAMPPFHSALLMLGAGIAWGMYSVLGRQNVDPIRATAGNFLRTIPFVIPVYLVASPEALWDGAGVGYAVISGAIASAVGYAIWYAALPGLKATQAAVVQLSVPIIAALGGIVFLNEAFTVRFGCASAMVLGGIGLVLYPKINAARL